MCQKGREYGKLAGKLKAENRIRGRKYSKRFSSTNAKLNVGCRIIKELLLREESNSEQTNSIQQYFNTHYMFLPFSNIDYTYIYVYRITLTSIIQIHYSIALFVTGK